MGKSDVSYTDVDHLKMDTVREYFSVFQLSWGSSTELSWSNICNRKLTFLHDIKGNVLPFVNVITHLWHKNVKKIPWLMILLPDII